MMHGEPVSPVDAAWLRMDSATNPMIITTLLALDGPLDRAAVSELVSRLVAHPRFRQRIAEPSLGVGVPHWVNDPYFDPALHVHRIALPSPGDDAAVIELVSDLMSAPLDRTRPLWQMHVVERGATSFIVFRVHHCVGDGVALVDLLLSIVGIDARPPEVGLSPPHPPAQLGDLARRGASQAMAFGKLLLLPSDPPTPLKGAQSRLKRAAWSRAIPLPALKRAARAIDAKVNDLLLASTTAALRDYFLERGAMRAGLEVHAVVPVFFRGSSDAALGNHFGLVFAALPLGCSAPLDRVRAVKRRMDDIKGTPEASVAFAILGAAGMASAEIENVVVDIFSRKGSLMVTNVPGPPVPLTLAGRTLETLMVWAPTAGHIGVGVSLLSYAGSVRLGISSDAALVPDPGAIVSAFERDLDDVQRLALAAAQVEGGAR